ncbi:MAG TPA: DUF1801 domain-containing protein [Cytophagales bacterium]|nr:DUF1801 domain-containing protein [Cytophagales bacterium]HCR53295.1 DUF1801 domain-containing protein [Cytophagales bacterium]
MAELKTKKTNASVTAFLNKVKNEKRRADSFAVLELMKSITKEEPKMWGSSIVGFGSYHYVYASGREGDWMVTGFSPRAQNLTLYIMTGFDRYETLMKKLGKYKTGKSCLYISKLEDVDQSVLKALIQASVLHMKKRH